MVISATLGPDQMSRVTVVNVRLPDEIIRWLDSLVDKDIYNSRSEAIRDFSRRYVLRMREGHG